MAAVTARLALNASRVYLGKGVDGAKVFASNGCVLDKPLKPRFPLTKVLSTVGLAVSVGSYSAKSMAAFLEDNEIFVPEHDDDE